MLTFDQLFELVEKKCANGAPVRDLQSTPPAIVINGADIRNVCRFLQESSSVYFDMLSCLTAVDNGPAADTMEVIYSLYSIPFNHHLTLKVTVSRKDPNIDSVSMIWKTANWHEREAFDMFGIRFNGHPDLRRILLPADWEGYPLRKDYKHQEYYRDVRVEY